MRQFVEGIDVEHHDRRSSTSAATGTTGGASGNTASAPGVSPTTIKVALVTSLTGSDSSNSVTIPKGFAARIAAQNAAGGVDGRKITYVVEDDQSSPTAAATAAGTAVNAGAFAVDYNSPFAFGAIKYLAQAGIPTVGGAYDGPEWSQIQTFPNMFSWTPVLFPSYPIYTTDAQFIKDQGGTRVAAVGYGISPSSSAVAKGMAPAAKAVGITAPYINSSLPFGTVNVTAIALQMKSENVNSLYGPIDPNTLLAILTAAQQTGVNLKVTDMSTGYGEDFLTDAGRQSGRPGRLHGHELAGAGGVEDSCHHDGAGGLRQVSGVHRNPGLRLDRGLRVGGPADQGARGGRPEPDPLLVHRQPAQGDELQRGGPGLEHGQLQQCASHPEPDLLVLRPAQGQAVQRAEQQQARLRHTTPELGRERQRPAAASMA